MRTRKAAQFLHELDIVPCRTCRGKGFFEPTEKAIKAGESDLQTCGQCNGHGRIYQFKVHAEPPVVIKSEG